MLAHALTQTVIATRFSHSRSLNSASQPLSLSASHLSHLSHPLTSLTLSPSHPLTLSPSHPLSPSRRVSVSVSVSLVLTTQGRRAGCYLSPSIGTHTAPTIAASTSTTTLGPILTAPSTFAA